MTTIDTNCGKIASGGCGGFLNPPTHPEHNRSVRNLYGGERNYFLMSLSSAVTCEWLDKAAKAQAKAILDAWIAPPIDSAEIQDWIYHTLGYFKNCYTRDKANRNVNNKETFYISKDENAPLDHHLGVLHIQQYYPDYEPLDVHFNNAYWGTKKSVS